MSSFPHHKYTLVIKGDVAFVKDKSTGRTVGIYKNGHYHEFTTAEKKKRRKRQNSNGKGGTKWTL